MEEKERVDLWIGLELDGIILILWRFDIWEKGGERKVGTRCQASS